MSSPAFQFNASGSGYRRRGRARLLVLVVAAFVVEASVAAATVSKPKDLIGAAIAVLGIALAIARPRAIGACALVFIALIPVYAAPELGALELQPSVCAFWLCALGAAVLIIGRNERLSFSAIDVAAGLFALTTLMSVVVGAATPTEWVQNTFYWLGPYLGLRLLLSRTRDATWLPRWFALAAAAVSPFAAYEFITGRNLFLHLNYNKAEAAIWATTQSRLGVERVDASFGQAIAFGMFMATALLFAITLAASAQRRRVRFAWLALAAVFLGCLAVSVARTGWVVAAVGLVLLACGSAGAVRRALVGLLATIAVVMAIATVALPNSPISPVTLFSQEGSSSQLANSDSWRVDLLSNALSGRLSLFGTNAGDLAFGLASGDTSVDSAYLSVANNWGIVAMLALLGVAATVAASLWRLRRDSVRFSVAAVTLANFVGLLFVALITQQNYYIWALVGATAALAAGQSRRELRGSPGDARGVRYSAWSASRPVPAGATGGLSRMHADGRTSVVRRREEPPW